MTSSVCSSSKTDYESEEERIVLHVYDDESKEFTSLTTYHGMIRIYTSETWPSRIFWGVVVVTCVTLFMIQGGVLLEFYNNHPTATKTDTYKLPTSFLPSISICPYGFINDDDDDIFRLITEGDKYIRLDPFILQNSSRSILIKKSFTCHQVVDSMQISNNEYIDFCSNSKTQITDIGVCFTFENWKDYQTSKLKIKFKKSFQKQYTIHVHSEPFEVSRATIQGWLKSGTSAKLAFSVEETQFLPYNDWGTCKVQNGEVYNYLGCVQQCYTDGFSKNCGCSPFYDRLNSTHCTIQDVLSCPEIAKVSCYCPVQCYSQFYNFQPLSYLKNHKKVSSITFELNSNLLKSHQQYKRFKQIDLMSYLGGVMGLFLGMSCITLLEVFIYLFKTVFGTLNNNRHKEFIDKLLSNDERSIHGSHEEIIITQKVEKPVPRIVEPILEQHESETNAEPKPMRRFSLMPAMTNQLGMKVQIHRPNHTLKRNSVYLGNCDF